jgi:outer membrane receptor protein involved in Fe transport
LRVRKGIVDPASGQLIGRIPTSEGVAKSTGLELDLQYLLGERWSLDFALGLLDTEYLDVGDPPPDGTGLQPGIPFQYAPETSWFLSAKCRLPLANGAELLFTAAYGWMDKYQRANASDFQTKNPDGSNRPEPAYGLLNARIDYRARGASWMLSLFGTSSTREVTIEVNVRSNAARRRDPRAAPRARR